MPADEGNADRIAQLAERFASMSPEELKQDADFHALSDEDRAAIAAYADQRAVHLRERSEADLAIAEPFQWAASVDPLEVLELGWSLVDELMTATEPARLLAWMDRIGDGDRRDLVAGLFALLLWQHHSALEDDKAPPAMRQLNQRWWAHCAEQRRQHKRDGGEQ
jgi:hypothetical protein